MLVQRQQGAKPVPTGWHRPSAEQEQHSVVRPATWAAVTFRAEPPVRSRRISCGRRHVVVSAGGRPAVDSGRLPPTPSQNHVTGPESKRGHAPTSGDDTSYADKLPPESIVGGIPTSVGE